MPLLRPSGQPWKHAALASPLQAMPTLGNPMVQELRPAGAADAADASAVAGLFCYVTLAAADVVPADPAAAAAVGCCGYCDESAGAVVAAAVDVRLVDGAAKVLLRAAAGVVTGLPAAGATELLAAAGLKSPAAVAAVPVLLHA